MKAIRLPMNLTSHIGPLKLQRLLNAGRRILVSRPLLACVAFAIPAAVFADESQTAGWTSLFNGKDLSNWTVVNGGEFSATNGVIHLDKGKGWLRSAQQYTNFVFEAEWRALDARYNSGFLIRAGREGKPFPTDVWQVNLKQTALGGLMRGSKTLVTNTAAAAPVGEWVKFRIQVKGSRIALGVDGKPLWEFNNLDAVAGFIGLQAEGKSFEFRNLRIQTLPSGD